MTSRNSVGRFMRTSSPVKPVRSLRTWLPLRNLSRSLSPSPASKLVLLSCRPGSWLTCRLTWMTRPLTRSCGSRGRTLRCSSGRVRRCLVSSPSSVSPMNNWTISSGLPQPYRHELSSTILTNSVTRCASTARTSWHVE